MSPKPVENGEEEEEESSAERICILTERPLDGNTLSFPRREDIEIIIGGEGRRETTKWPICLVCWLWKMGWWKQRGVDDRVGDDPVPDDKSMVRMRKMEVVEESVVIGGLVGVQFVYAANSILLSYLMSLGLNPLTLVVFSAFATFLVLSPVAFLFERLVLILFSTLPITCLQRGGGGLLASKNPNALLLCEKFPISLSF